MKKIVSFVFSALLLNASSITSSKRITIDDAVDMLKTQNLEIKAASLDVEAAKADVNKVNGANFGKLDFLQDFARSNDAGNVFGFKLTSREANFNDFGFDEFLAQMGGLPGNTAELLATQPNNLNHPEYRNFFQTKLKYELPIFTGFMLSSYSDIMKSVKNIKSLEKDQILNEKIYQVRKSFYDMALLRESTKNLNTILENINTLESMTKSMIDEGYAKKVDLLEVEAKKSNVERLVLQMESNQKLLLHYISFLLNQKVADIKTPVKHIKMPNLTDEDILKNNLDIQKADQGLEVRKNMLDVSKAAYYPVVGGFAEVATADDKFMNDMDNHKAYTIGARMQWNIFNGGSDIANVEKSRLEHLKMQTQVQLAKKGISLKFDKIKTEIKTCDEEINSLQKELNLVDAIYENYVGRYKEKLSSMSDVIIKQSEQIKKILELQMANNKRNEKIFSLEKLANGEQK